MSSSDPPERSDPPPRRMSPEERARHSVFNEPNIFPGRPNEVLQSDWRCSECGYNLRGLMTGAKCPECGHIEIYRPPPEGEISYASWYRGHRAVATRTRRWLVLLMVIVASGPLAVVGTVFATMLTLLGPVLIAPAIEEVMKLGVILLIIETRPYWWRAESDIQLAAVAGALGFAVIENLLYLNVYFPSPPFGLILWRWIVCTGLHLGCTLVAAEGAAAVWRNTDEQQREPILKHLFRPLSIAIVLHASYNAIVSFASFVAYGF